MKLESVDTELIKFVRLSSEGVEYTIGQHCKFDYEDESELFFVTRPDGSVVVVPYSKILYIGVKAEEKKEKQQPVKGAKNEQP